MRWNAWFPTSRRMWHFSWDCVRSGQLSMWAQKCGKSLEETREILMELAQIGVCKVYHNEAGEEVFLVQIFAPGILEMMVNNDEQVKAHPSNRQGL